jgi:hypothetical protein
MNVTRLHLLFGMLLATSSVAARGGCGPCGSTPYTHDEEIPLLPPSSDGGAPGPIDITAACDDYCRNAQSCDKITLHSGGASIDALACHFVEINTCGGAGRAPANTTRPTLRDASTAAWLATTAALESASVRAFRELRSDLAAHRAPRALLRRASRAARDEARHTRSMRSLARRRGRSTPLRSWSLSSHETPSLEQLATQNAVEGCVREAFAALLAHHQARHATNAEMRAAMKKIAQEETEHAALSFAVDAWALARLPLDARARVESARASAVRELIQSPLPALDPTAAQELGLPSVCVAARLATRLAEAT